MAKSMMGSMEAKAAAAYKAGAYTRPLFSST